MPQADCLPVCLRFGKRRPEKPVRRQNPRPTPRLALLHPHVPRTLNRCVPSPSSVTRPPTARDPPPRVPAVARRAPPALPAAFLSTRFRLRSAFGPRKDGPQYRDRDRARRREGPRDAHRRARRPQRRLAATARVSSAVGAVTRAGDAADRPFSPRREKPGEPRQTTRKSGKKHHSVSGNR